MKKTLLKQQLIALAMLLCLALSACRKESSFKQVSAKRNPLKSLAPPTLKYKIRFNPMAFATVDITVSSSDSIKVYHGENLDAAKASAILEFLKSDGVQVNKKEFILEGYTK